MASNQPWFLSTTSDFLCFGHTILQTNQAAKMMCSETVWTLIILKDFKVLELFEK